MEVSLAIPRLGSGYVVGVIPPGLAGAWAGGKRCGAASVVDDLGHPEFPGRQGCSVLNKMSQVKKKPRLGSGQSEKQTGSTMSVYNGCIGGVLCVAVGREAPTSANRCVCVPRREAIICAATGGSCLPPRRCRRCVGDFCANSQWVGRSVHQQGRGFVCRFKVPQKSSQEVCGVR